MKSFAFDDEVAKEYGVEEAVVIRSFQFWIELNKANARNLKEGRTWTYNTYESLAEQFPFWVKKEKETGAETPDVGKIRRLMDSLISQGVLIKTSKFNKFRIDKTNWYAFEDEGRWLKAKSVENYPLPKNADEESLFADLDQESVNIAEGNENDENLRLSKKTDGKVSTPDLSDFATDEKNNSTAEKSSPAAEKDSSGLSNSADVSLLKTADQYQLLNNSLPADDEKRDASVNPFDLLINKTPLAAYYDGTADKLAFDFNDLDLVNAKIMQLFRIFVCDAQPHFAHVDAIRDALLNDMRPELSRKACWVIILKAFMEYPGTEKKYKTENALITRIGWKKNDFVQGMHTYQQKNETAIARSKGREQEKIDNQEAIDRILANAKEKLERYQHKLNNRQIEEIIALIKNRNYLQVDVKLIEFLEDNEAAA